MNMLNSGYFSPRITDPRVRIDSYNNLIVNPQTGGYVSGYDKKGYNLQTGWFNPAVAHQNSLSEYISQIPCILGTSQSPYPDEDYPSLGRGIDDFHNYRRIMQVQPPRYSDNGKRYRDALYNPNDGHYYYTDTGEIQSPEYEARKMGIPFPQQQQQYQYQFNNVNRFGQPRYYSNAVYPYENFNAYQSPYQEQPYYNDYDSYYYRESVMRAQRKMKEDWDNYVFGCNLDKRHCERILKRNGVNYDQNLLNSIFTPWENTTTNRNKLMEPEYVELPDGGARIIKDGKEICSGKITSKRVFKSQLQRKTQYLYSLRFRLGFPTYVEIVNKTYFNKLINPVNWKNYFPSDTGLVEFLDRCGECFYDLDRRKELLERRQLSKTIYRPESYSALIAEQSPDYGQYHGFGCSRFTDDYTIYDTGGGCSNLDDMDLSDFKTQLQSNLKEAREQRKEAFLNKIRDMAAGIKDRGPYLPWQT